MTSHTQDERLTLVSTTLVEHEECISFLVTRQWSEEKTLHIWLYLSKELLDMAIADPAKRSWLVQVLRNGRKFRAPEYDQWTEKLYTGEPNVVKAFMTDKPWRELEGWV